MTSQSLGVSEAAKDSAQLSHSEQHMTICDICAEALSSRPVRSRAMRRDLVGLFDDRTR